jgi:nitrate/nitrite transporter NarK
MQKFQAKKIFLVLHVMMFIATILLPFADTRDRYWPLIFIAFVIGTMSAMGIYIGAR